MSHTRILLGLLAGAAVGLVMNTVFGKDADVVVAINTWVCGPVGQVFLRALFMVVMPLVFCSVVVGIAGIGDVRVLGRIGGRTAFFFMATTVIAVLIRPM